MKASRSAILICIAFACDENEPKEVDVIPPLIEVVSPDREMVYGPGDTVRIMVVFSDNADLRKGSVHIHDLSMPSPNDTVFVLESFMQGNAFALDTFWIVNDPLDTSYVIYFDCVDRAENLSDQLRYFHQFY